MSYGKLRSIADHREMRIPMTDGKYLSARAWIPADATANPVPAILEYIPYRKSDATAESDALAHPWFAERGYACLRVDRRGCGDSEGLFDDEYSEKELQDGEDLIHWVAAQPWCTGAVGMQGISWGGFNSLQLAARSPEPLKAIITVGSTVDRYADDIHYKGGLQLGENIGWAATVLSWFSLPPEPELAGEEWRDIWLHRLENTPFLARTWTEHSNRDPYWKHGSVCEDYGAIKAAVLAVGGLQDGYRNTMASLLENITAPVKGIAGPWGHRYPHDSQIGPSMGYLQESLRWWDHWLKGVDRGVENDPDYRVYVMDSDRPDASASHRDGRWIAEEHWPSPDITQRRFLLGPEGLGDSEEPFRRVVSADLRHGEQCGEYYQYGIFPDELPGDQAPDDARAACFDSAPLSNSLDIVGAPSVKLRLSADRPRAQVVVRLCDLRPDGTSMLIALGLLNLRHRNGFERTDDLTPGETVDVVIPLDQAGYRIPAGHRLRLAIASSYWPYVWPEPEQTSLTLEAGALDLPLRPLAENDEWSAPPPVSADPLQMVTLREATGEKRRDIDPETGQVALIIHSDQGKMQDPRTRLAFESAVTETWRIDPTDPAASEVQIEWTRALERDEWRVDTRATTIMKGRRDHYDISQQLEASENSKPVFAKTWTHRSRR